MTKRREYKTTDAQPVVLYAKTDTESEHAYPVILGTDGVLKITQSFGIPEYDEINMDYSGEDITKVVYTLSGVTQATLTLSYTGSNLTKIVKT